MQEIPQSFHVLHIKSNCFGNLELHSVSCNTFVTAHADFILYYFLDQIRMTCIAGFSNFLHIVRSFARPKVQTLVVKIRLLSRKTPISECFFHK